MGEAADLSWLTRLKPSAANHFKMLQNTEFFSAAFPTTGSAVALRGVSLVSAAEQLSLWLSIKHALHPERHGGGVGEGVAQGGEQVIHRSEGWSFSPGGSAGM